MEKAGIHILDFGSQFTQLIVRRLRELGIYCEVHPFDISLKDLKIKKPDGLILSGGPNSVFKGSAPQRDLKELAEIAPLLGICYGMQLITQQWGGVVERSDCGEYGLNHIHWKEPLKDVPRDQKVWMSHGDHVKVVPFGFKVMAVSEKSIPTAIRLGSVWALQFHPEVSHTDCGLNVLKSFVFDCCGAQDHWKKGYIVDDILEDIKKSIPKKESVLCALSGGVDSTVVGTLLTRALGHERVHCLFINNGLLRQEEFEDVLESYGDLGLNVKGIDATEKFIAALRGESNPEKKRKIIGRVFIEVFEDAVKSFKDIKWLAQGTLYPDVIESLSPNGVSVTIKSHHNVGGLPKKMGFKLIEPLREFFKDEVRDLGKKLNLPKAILSRHPFPGPGLAIRIIGEVTERDLEILRRCDAIYIDELKSSGLYNKIWQALSVLLPVKTVGVQGDSRTYSRSLVIRAVSSEDGMTADWFHFEPDFLKRLSNRITNEVLEINRIVYDITSKPPSTIEWE